MRSVAAILAVICSIATAAAQQPERRIPPQIVLTLTPQETAIVGQALDELPAKVSVPVARRILQQMEAQIESFNRPPEPKPEPEAQK